MEKSLIKCLGIDIIGKKGDNMKLNRKILTVLFFIVIIMSFHQVCYAGRQHLYAIDYDVQVNKDGSMEVVETWDVYIVETNTLFKSFELDQSKYSGITDVKVKNLETGRDLTQINEEMYHVTKDCYYALPVAKDKFEIAWGVGLDDTSDARKYEVSYTVKDAITVYNDCSEFYWQFIGKDSAVPATRVRGTIKLPQEVQDLENLKVWAHGPLNGRIEKVSNDTVSFYVGDLPAKTMVEIRIAVGEKMFSGDARSLSQNKLDKILQEETKWANKANRIRDKAIMREVIVEIAKKLLCVFALIYFARKVSQYYKELKKMPKKIKIDDIGEYFRDIPREKEATPAEASFLQNYPKSMNENAVLSATLLQLCLKGYLSFEKENQKDIQIHILKPMGNDLKKSERIVYDLLTKSTNRKDTQMITMNEIENWAKYHYDEFDSKLKEIEKSAKDFHANSGNYDLNMEREANECSTSIIYYIVGCILIFPLAIVFEIFLTMILLLIEWIVCIVLLKKKVKRFSILTHQGEIEKQQWKALKKYMEDFSLLKERGIPDLILWEKYLVYATAFGISDKVIDQLKVVYPQMQNLHNGTYTYLYLMSDTRFSNGFIHELNQSTNHAYSAYRSAYHAAHSSSSSGSGGGGGFSSGGGGRWWRWPEWAEDKR